MSPIDFTEKATTMIQKLLDVTKDVFCKLSVIYFFPHSSQIQKKWVQLFCSFLFYFKFIYFFVGGEVGELCKDSMQPITMKKKNYGIFPQNINPSIYWVNLWLSLQSHKVVTLFGDLF
jgi:hypothetical protein